MGFVHHITAAAAATGWMENSRSRAGALTRTPPFPTPTDLICTPISAARRVAPVPPNVESIPLARHARSPGRRA
jgi:hypothetical protein